MISGPERTMKMDEVVDELKDLLENKLEFDVAEALRSDDRGIRLAAYTYLIAQPGKIPLDRLVERAVREDKPFGQNLALTAVRRQQQAGETLSDVARGQLRYLRGRLGDNTDRAGVLDDILQEPDPGKSNT
jgi:hypothetical protein